MATVPRVAAPSDRQPPAGKMTYEEFLAWADEDTWAEWVDGEVIVMSPASIPHQLIMGFLSWLLKGFVDAFDLGEIFTPPTQMKLPGSSGREPDILFLAREHFDRLRHNWIDGPADVVVEIASPDSRTRDRRDKFAEYEAGGVREYWIVDADRRRAAFHQLGTDGRYHAVEPGVDGVYLSAALPGFRLRVSWLWQQPLPKPRDVMREAGVPAI